MNTNEKKQENTYANKSDLFFIDSSFTSPDILYLFVKKEKAIQFFGKKIYINYRLKLIYPKIQLKFIIITANNKSKNTNKIMKSLNLNPKGEKLNDCGL